VAQLTWLAHKQLGCLAMARAIEKIGREGERGLARGCGRFGRETAQAK